MKRAMAMALWLAAGFAVAATAWAAPPTPRDQAAALHAAQNLMAFQHNDAALRFKQLAAVKRLAARGAKAGNPIDITHTLVALGADLSAGNIETTSTLTVKALADGVSTAEFTVGPLESFTVADGAGNLLDFTVDSYYGLVTVTLPETLNEGEETTLEFNNSGAPNCEPDSFFGMQFCTVTEQIVFFAFTEWLPTKAAYTYEDLMTTGAIDLDIYTPADYVAASTSDPAGVDVDGDNLIHHFVGHFPTTYIGLAFGQYQTFEAATADSKPVKTYVWTGDADYAQRWAEIGAQIIDYFGGVYTPYLYNKQDIIQAIDELGGGVGPQSATFYYASALAANPDDYYSETIFSHEIAHSWWANMIVASDVYSPWLSEGFAEYSSRLFGYQLWDEYYQDYLYEVYFRYFQLFVDPLAEVPMTGEATVMGGDAMAYQAATYWKGSHFLRMLQWLIGDDAFFAGMKTYAEEHVWVNSHAFETIDSFRTAMEAASGEDLQAFFDQWVTTKGYPTYRWAAEFGADGDVYTARVRIEQTQTAEFDLPIQVEIYAGEATEPEQHRLEFDGKIADQTFTLDEKPRAVRVDGRWWIWGDKINELTGDIDSSNEVDGIDFVYAAWSLGGDLTSQDSSHWNYFWDADFNLDGKVDQTDFDQLLANFGKKGRIND